MKLTLKAPADNSVVSLMTELQREYLENTCRVPGEPCGSFDYLNLKRSGRDDTFPEPVVFEWEADSDDADEFELILSTDPNFEHGVRYACEGCRLSVKNLLIGQRYYWKLTTPYCYESETFCFTTDPTAPRWIEAGGLSNIRDIGGRAARNRKRVRQGMVFRGSEMEFHHTITTDGIDTLAVELGIRTDLDLRGEAVGRVNGSALGDRVAHRLIPCKAYADFLDDRETARELFTLFTDPEAYPIYVHCWGGADRTGTLILILCAILGVGERELFADYELTSLSIWGARSIYSELFSGLLSGLDRYSDGTADIGAKCRGFLHECGIGDEQLECIRDILLEE